MSIPDEIVAISPGARFYRADLHIHSYPASHDVKDTAMTPEGVVAQALSEGLRLIAITDHNDISNVQAAIAAAVKSDLCVIPGVELSTSAGHLLVYFSKYAELEAYMGKLSIEGKGTSTSRCTTSMLECLKQIDPDKGFAILAHVDGPKGLEVVDKTFSPHKADIITNSALLGIELCNHESTISYSDEDPVPERAQMGKKRIETLGLGAKQNLARCVFSDSHKLSALGKNVQGKRRITRIKMETPSFEGLRIALQDADARIRIEEEIPESVPYVLGAKFDGGFLDGQVIHFSRNLNCLIGGRGAGKSTALEAVRCISDIVSDSTVVDSEIWPETLHLVWIDQAGQQHALSRRRGENIVNTTDPIDGPTVFSIESYGQNETAQMGKQAETDPSLLLAYLDKFIDEIDEDQSLDESLRDALLENQTKIEKAAQQTSLLPSFEKRLANTQQQLAALKSANGKEIIELEQKIAEERTLRSEIKGYVEDYQDWIKDTSFTEALENIQAAAVASELRVGSVQFEKISSQAASLEVAATKSQTSLAKDVGIFAKAVQTQLEQWKAKEQEAVEEINKKRAELKAQGVKLDLPYIQKLATDESSHKSSIANLKRWQATYKQLQTERKRLLSERASVRSTIATKRTAFAAKSTKALKGSLSDLAVSVRFIEGGYSPEAETIIQQAMSWRTSQVPKAPLLVQGLTFPKLMECIQKSDPAPILALKDGDGNKPFSRTEANAIISTLSTQECLHQLQRCNVEDRPRIVVTKLGAVTPGSKPMSKEFGKLSLGQQSSVLLALMLSSDSNEPLIIDQPEDNLDSEFIFQSLVPVLRAAKERRQIIIVTHNPNIAVLGDAELIVVLKSTSDKSSIVARGSIDDPQTKKMVCKVLEGAEEAFKRRAKIYGPMQD